MKLATTIPPAGWRRLLFFIAGGLVLVVVWMTYSPSSAESVEYLWDDHILVEHHMATERGSIGHVFRSPFWRTVEAAEHPTPYYRPLVVLSYRFDRALDTGAPAQNRTTNVLLHLLCCAFVSILATRLGAPPTASIIASLIWGLFPRLAESVAWISGRTDVLACAFGLASLITAPDPASKPSSVAIQALRSLLAGVLLFLSFASKEVGLAFSFAIGTWYLVRRQSFRKETALFMVATVGLPLTTYFVIRSLALKVVSVGGGRSLPTDLRVTTALEAIGRYAEMMVDPFRPCASIGYVGEPDMLRVAVGALLVLLVFAAGIVCTLQRRRRLDVENPTCSLPMIVLFLGSIGLVVQILPLNLSGAVTADRLLYVPLAALVVLGAVQARKLVRSPLRVRLSVACLALVFAAAESLRTEARAADFSSEGLFWVTTAERSHPHNSMPLSALAGVLREDGDVDRACRLLTISHRLLATSGASASARARTTENLASCFALIGRYDEALTLMEERAREQPNSPRVMMAVGFARLHVLDIDRAEDAFRRAQALDMNESSVQHRAIVGSLQRFPEIRADLLAFEKDSRALRGDIVRYARFLSRIGRLPEAEEAFMTIATDPNAPSSARAEALEFLAMYAPYELVVRAQQACVNVPLDGVIEARLASRHRQHKKIAPLLNRIDALLSRPR